MAQSKPKTEGKMSKSLSAKIKAEKFPEYKNIVDARKQKIIEKVERVFKNNPNLAEVL